MVILFFYKENKDVAWQARERLEEITSDVVAYKGQPGDSFPKEALNHTPELTIAFLSPWIIPAELLSSTMKYSINFHPGPPEYPGIGCTNFAIYHEETEFGVTAHLMEKTVDSGEILKVIRFPLKNDDTVYSLTQRCYLHLLKLFDDVLEKFFSEGELSPANIHWKQEPYTTEDLEALCEIKPEMSEAEVEQRIRATHYPDMPGPYVELFDHKFEYNPDR